MNNGRQSACCIFHIGKRPNYEDNFLFAGRHITPDEQKQMPKKRLVCLASDCAKRVMFFAVSDGMGGHNAGEVASLICIEKLAELEMTVQNCLDIKDVVTLCQSAISDINAIVCESSHKDAYLKGMGATLVLLVVCGAEYAILNIGDSRAYHFGGNTLVQITKDNTEGQRMLDLGLLSRKELANFPARKNLSRYIGFNESGLVLQADEYYPALDKGILLLCSDGVSDSLTDNQIEDILCSENDLASVGKKLIETAVAVEQSDNATAILVPIGR